MIQFLENGRSDYIPNISFFSGIFTKLVVLKNKLQNQNNEQRMLMNIIVI